VKHQNEEHKLLSLLLQHCTYDAFQDMQYQLLAPPSPFSVGCSFSDNTRFFVVVGRIKSRLFVGSDFSAGSCIFSPGTILFSEVQYPEGTCFRCPRCGEQWVRRGL